MSHHYTGPQFGFPHGDARLDLTDLFAFPKPGDAHKSILILNVHPSVSFDPRGPTMFEPSQPMPCTSSRSTPTAMRWPILRTVCASPRSRERRRLRRCAALKVRKPPARVTTDGIGANNDLLADFPYLGPPHRDAREPGIR
jgi:hypothetical protein